MIAGVPNTGRPWQRSREWPRLDSAEVVDTSDGRNPLGFHSVQDHVVPGLEQKSTEMPEILFAMCATSEEVATLDFNHPLAGQNLNFSVTVRDVPSVGGGRIIVPGEV